MIVVKVNLPQFEYDIRAILKAYYPAETVLILDPETGREKYDTYVSHAVVEVTIDPNGSTTLLFQIPNACETQREGTKEKRYDWNPVSIHGQDSIISDKNFYKNAFKKFFYQSIQDYTGKNLPWGNLTGIRPTKIALGLLEQGKSEEQVCDFLKEEHFVSAEKIALGVDIAKREREILSTLHYENGYSLYVGIPFCPTTCLYCSFTSYPICSMKDKVELYINCLIKEMRFTADLYKDKILDTVYIGGGTPTTLQAHQLDRLITALQEIFDFSTVQEFTVEAGRADSITGEKLALLKKKGVTRISVNPQTMNEETLRFIGRKATAAETVEAYKLARSMGFDNINMDIILGLPGETEKDVTETIQKIVALSPDSLTVHSLAIKRASKLREFIEQNGIEMLHNGEETMKIASEGAKALSMKPYYLYRQKNMTGNLENVGFAREGKYGIYNILIMEEMQTIVALGAGTVTKRVYPEGRIERCDCVKDVGLYIEKIDEMIERKKKLLTLS